MSSERFNQLLVRYKTENYGVSSNQDLVDPRMDSGLDILSRPAAAHYIPNALEPAEDEAVVMAILPGTVVPTSAEDPSLRIMTDSDRAQEKTFNLKCYVLTRPTCRHISVNKIVSLDPIYISLLPTFKATITDDESPPLVGDIVVVKYDNLAHTEGKFIKLVGKNVSDMFAETAAAGSEESLASAFESGAAIAEIAASAAAPIPTLPSLPGVGSAPTPPDSPAAASGAGIPGPGGSAGPSIPQRPPRSPDIFDVSVVGYDGYGE